MPVQPKGARLSALLENDTVARLERLRMNSSRRFTDRRRGEHLTGKGGSSIEFSDYRDYVPGDDIRYVDWNIFSRLHRPYLKLYHQEEEMHVAILVDASSSMLLDAKLHRAKQLAAAFGLMGLFGGERVTVYAFSTLNSPPLRLPARSGRGTMRELFTFVEGIEGGGEAPLEDGVSQMLKYHRGRGMAVLISDFLTFGDLRLAFNRVFSAGMEPSAVQVLSPVELDPQIAGDTRFVDCETDQTLDVTCNAELLRLYNEYREEHEIRLGQLCKERGGRFVCTSASDSVEWILFDLFRRRGWVR